MPDKNPQGDFIWYELMTPDADASARFYSDVVGWDVQPYGEGVDYQILHLSDGAAAGGMLPLTEEVQQGGARPAWLGYVGVDDVDAAVADWAEAGGDVHKEPWDAPGVGRMAMVADPDGIPLYLMRGDSPEPSRAFSVDEAGHVRWNELAAEDDQAALDFYGGRFGWESPEKMDMGDMGDYHFLFANGTRIGALMRKPAEAPAPGWLYYFGVEDIEAAAEKIRAGGGQVMMDVHEVPGGEFIVVAADPQGAAFGLVGPKKS